MYIGVYVNYTLHWEVYFCNLYSTVRFYVQLTTQDNYDFLFATINLFFGSEGGQQVMAAHLVVGNTLYSKDTHEKKISYPWHLQDNMAS